MADTVNVERRADLTVRIFDRFYNFELSVPVNEYDAVYSFFASLTNNRESAENLAYSIFRISNINDVPAMELLEQFRGKNQIEITALVAYYLNEVRSSATLLGVQAQVQPNFYTARNVQI